MADLFSDKEVKFKVNIDIAVRTKKPPDTSSKLIYQKNYMAEVLSQVWDCVKNSDLENCLVLMFKNRFQLMKIVMGINLSLILLL